MGYIYIYIPVDFLFTFGRGLVFFCLGIEEKTFLAGKSEKQNTRNNSKVVYQVTVVQ